MFGGARLAYLGGMLFLTAAGLCACDRSEPAETPPVAIDANPTSQPSDRSTGNPTSLPTRTHIAIGGEPYAFPPAKLRISHDNDQNITAVLYSDDPPEAVKDGYRGNSFYLPMTLDITDTADLPNATWRYKAANSERNDTPSGIFLEGSAIQLQPFDTLVEFAPEDEFLVLTLSGEFLMFTSHQPQNPGQLKTVAAQILVHIENK